jgi:hypothetical protein
MAMQRSSASIGTLAAALAKAQAQLINPEKSMVATVGSDGSGKGGQIFRYAPLSSGLDIVRKTLGQHEIATIQTTAVDQTAREPHDSAGPFVGGMDRFGLPALAQGLGVCVHGDCAGDRAVRVIRLLASGSEQDMQGITYNLCHCAIMSEDNIRQTRQVVVEQRLMDCAKPHPRTQSER